MKLDKDGKLAISEREVEAAIEAFLVTKGFMYIHTKAENVKRNGSPAHAKGTLDAVAMNLYAGRCSVVHIELKRRKARTNKQHLAEQSATVASLRKAGYLVYQAAENDSEPIESFRRWWKEYVG